MRIREKGHTQPSRRLQARRDRRREPVKVHGTVRAFRAVRELHISGNRHTVPEELRVRVEL
jgi:hypothetical protein